MKIVIIEDEKLTADDLAETILKVMPGAQITAFLYSIASAINWFRKNEQPDLIFSDIQLGDGLCFEIFKNVPASAPIIFCTAFDKYALKAFDANGIDYILKPFDKKNIADAFQKYNRLKEKLSKNTGQIEQIIQLFENMKQPSCSSVLVFKQDKILPIKYEDIALFYIENEIIHLITFDNRHFTINKTIELIEKESPDDFYRVNRQYIVNRKAIREASRYFARKLSLTLNISFKGTVTVSKNKVADFLNWLSEN